MSPALDPTFQAVLSEVEQKRDELRCSRSGAYFRGHSSRDYCLVPSLLRKDVASFEIEHNLFHDCYARSPELLRGGRSSWEALSILQHHGIPTRLLDWTESFAASLFFALTGDDDSVPDVWIVNGFRLNQAAGVAKRGRIPLAGIDLFPDYEESFVRVDDRRKWPYRKPVFVQIPWSSERVTAQQGFFTIHPDATPLDEACPRWVRKVEIPRDAVAGARRFLEITGVNEYVLFPDLQGLGNFLRDRYRLT
jgi:hypothetical protein